MAEAVFGFYGQLIEPIKPAVRPVQWVLLCFNGNGSLQRSEPAIVLVQNRADGVFYLI